MTFETQIFPATKCTKPVVIGWFLGAVAWRTCGWVCAASGMGATTQRKKLAYNASGVCVRAISIDETIFKTLNIKLKFLSDGNIH